MVNIFKKINKENQSSIIVFINNSNHFLSSNEKMRKLQTENIILKEKISKLKDSISSIL